MANTPLFPGQLYGIPFSAHMLRHTPQFRALPNILSSDGLDLEMQCYQGEHQRFEILDKVVKDTQTFRVLRFCNIDERTNLGGLSRSFST